MSAVGRRVSKRRKGSLTAFFIGIRLLGLLRTDHLARTV